MNIGSDLLRFLDRPLVAMDLETQRVNQQHDNLPFEIAWLEAVRNRVLTSHQYYLRWPVAEYCRRMSAGAAQITRFHRGMLEAGEDPEEVLDRWEAYALDEKYIIVGHNIIFDFAIWNLWREALGRPKTFAWRYRFVDTNALAKAFKLGIKPDRSSPEAFYCWQRKMQNYVQKGLKTNLTQMCKDLGITVDEGKVHGAEYDLQVNLSVYWALVNQIEV